MNDMLTEVWLALSDRSEFAGVTIKSFMRPESLKDDKPSIVIVPVGPPEQAMPGSDDFLAQRYTYQINVESPDRVQAKEFAKMVGKVMLGLRFVQLTGGLDDYFDATKRYIDARTYRGTGALYADD